MALDKFQPYLFVSAGEQSNKYLTPVISPDGIAAFQAQRAQDLSGLSIRIDPVQEGTGDPSPDNIRPISGRTGLTVTRSGKNLLNWSLNTTGNAARVSLPTGTYTMSARDTNTAGAWYIRFTGGDGSYISDRTAVGLVGTWSYSSGSGYFYGQNNAQSFVFTIPDGCTLVEIGTQSGNGTNPAMLEVGNTASAYEAPNISTIPITWETEAGTVYGGTLDVVSGVLTVDKGFVKFSDKTWTVAASRFYCEITDTKEPQAQGLDFVCSAFARANVSDYATMPDNTAMLCPRNFSATRKLFVVRADAYASASDFLAAMGDQTLVYPLATPQTYQLTPTEVRTIAGYNQVYSDAGPVIDIKF